MKCPRCRAQITYVTYSEPDGQYYRCEQCRARCWLDGSRILPQSELQARVVEVERIAVRLERALADCRAAVERVERMATEVYFMPDMPGYHAARNAFEASASSDAGSPP